MKSGDYYLATLLQKLGTRQALGLILLILSSVFMK